MGKDKFLKDLKFGNDGEMVVYNHLKTIKPEIELIDTCNNSDYDFKIKSDNNEITYEVKTEDQYCKPGNNTGNIFVEIECNQKPSGIMRTKANWYAFYLPHYKQIWYIKTPMLIKLVEGGFFPLKKNSGDGGLVVGYAVARNQVKEYFNVFDL